MHFRFRHKNDRFDLFHGVATLFLRFEDIIPNLVAFLEENPSETLIISYQAAATSQGEGCTRTFTSTLEWYIDSYLEGKMYVGGDVPKLGDVRGKIVMLNFHGDGLANGSQGLVDAWSGETVANDWTPHCLKCHPCVVPITSVCKL